VQVLRGMVDEDGERHLGNGTQVEMMHVKPNYPTALGCLWGLPSC
jgi:hypothetical protein